MMIRIRRSKCRLTVLALLAVAFHFWVLLLLGHLSQMNPSSNILQSTNIQAVKSTSATMTKPPRMLVGILANAHAPISERYKERHLQLFTLWNDTRICPITQVRPQCQVVYTFVYGSTNTSLPPYQNHITPYSLQGIDTVQLHIYETMNEGKTPAYFQWALGQAETLGLDYVFECDSDSFIRWDDLLRYLNTELPYPTSSTVVGMFRHRAHWTNCTGETYWQQEWYAGMHLYLAGQLYGMSISVAQLMMQQANQGMPLSYFVGHEDHDATSMIQVASFQQSPPIVLRWVSISKSLSFWYHPVKGGYRWKRILEKEQQRRQEQLHVAESRPVPSSSWQSIPWIWKPSIVMIVLEASSSSQTTQQYLEEWKRRTSFDHICGISQWMTLHCDLYYVFVQGVDPSGPMENLIETLHVTVEENTWIFPLHPNSFHRGLVTTAMYWMHQQRRLDPFDYVLVVNGSFYIRGEDWNVLAHTQPAQHYATLLGELRDKYQSPREFSSRGREDFWWEEYDEIHLYLGSECFAIGSHLVAGIVEQAVSNVEAREKYWENNVGHDLTVLAYMVPNHVLHWVPVTNSMKFWES